jgi:hypothetical protein
MRGASSALCQDRTGPGQGWLCLTKAFMSRMLSSGRTRGPSHGPNRDTGLDHLMPGVPASERYEVQELSTHDVGPCAGPCYVPWTFDAQSWPTESEVAGALARLRREWSRIAGPALAFLLLAPRSQLPPKSRLSRAGTHTLRQRHAPIREDITVS